MKGYIKLHREIMESELYFSEKFTKMQALIDLMLLASHKTNLVYLKGIEIRLNPGELCYSQGSLAKRWSWNRETVKKYLTSLEKKGIVAIKANNVTTVIRLCQWELEQGVSGNRINEFESQHLNQLQKNFEITQNPQKSCLILPLARQQNKQRNQQHSDSGTSTNKNEKKLIYDFMDRINRIINYNSFLNIISLYLSQLGYTELERIYNHCILKDIKFMNENRLSSYLKRCNQKSVSEIEKLRTITLEEPGWQ